MLYKYLCKIIVLGNSSVGKTSIINRLVDNTWNNTETTIGVDFFSLIKTIDEYQVKLHIWDTSGQEAFRSIIKSYYRDVSGVILVCEKNNEKSIKDLEYWMKQIKENFTDPNVPVIVLCNKFDDFSNNVSYKDTINEKLIQDFLDKHKLSTDNYYKVSAKDDINLNKILDKLIYDIDNNIKNMSELKSTPGIQISKDNFIDISLKNPKPKKKKCC